MAEKKKDEFSYGSSFLPEGERKYSVIRWGWNGLNRTDKIDTGQLTYMSGVVCDPPYMEARKQPIEWISFETGIPTVPPDGDDYPEGYIPDEWDNAGVPISIAGFDNDVAVVWEIDLHTVDPSTNLFSTAVTRYVPTYDGRTKAVSNALQLTDHSRKYIPRSIVQFNAVNSSSGNIVNYTYDRKLLIYPDCYSVDYYARNGEPGKPFNTPNNPIPVSDLATVYNSRVFGATNKEQQDNETNNAVFASDYNSYAAYNLDTADDVSSNHAWWSMTNSNTDADGAIVAMCTFDNHVVLFKKDFMQLVYNNKNPFRIVDVGAYGCDNKNAWTILNGVLYFASRDYVYAYTGGTPKIISKKLGVKNLHNAVLGSYRDTLWLATREDHNALYTYKDGVWSLYDKLGALDDGYYIKQFAATDWGLVGLCYTNGSPIRERYYKLMIFDLDFSRIGVPWQIPEEWQPSYRDPWYFMIDIMALGKLDVRRVKKFSMLCEGKAGATVSVYLLKDGDPLPVDEDPDDDYDPKEKLLVGTLTLDEDGFGMLRVLTRQFSATMHQLYFEGSGYMKIHAAELKVSWGGDLYVES